MSEVTPARKPRARGATTARPRRMIAALVAALCLVAAACSTPEVPATDTTGLGTPFSPELAARIVVDVDVDGDGTVEVSPQSARPGETVVLNPVAGDGQRFIGWSGDATGSVSPLEITSDSDVSVIAMFGPIPAEDTLTVTIEGDGWVSRRSGPIAKGAATIVATPGPGQVFLGWNGDFRSGDRRLDLNVVADIDLTATFIPAPTSDPVINVWGGDELFFELGAAQRWINVRGNISDGDGIRDVYYELDGERFSLSLGPDNRRLESAGDFNIELDAAILQRGDNTITVGAQDRVGFESTQDVVVTFAPDRWSFPYRTEWAAAGNPSEQAQVVDGDWTVGVDGVQPVATGYDRLLAFGDSTWTDYRIGTTFTVESVNTAGFGGVSSQPLVGLVMRWPGHSDSGGTQPRWGFWPAGSFGGWKISLDGSFISIDGNQYRSAQTIDDVELEIGRTYSLVGTVTTTRSGSLHRIVISQVDGDDPESWVVEAEVDDGPDAGGVLLIAHHVDVVFGDVSITEL